MAAVVSKFAKIALLCAIAYGAGCESRPAPLRLGESFPVCVNAQNRIAVHGLNIGPDFDVVDIAVDGLPVKAVIGWHPNFSNGKVVEKVVANNQFAYLGKERYENVDRILWGYDRGDISGPIFVVFSAPELKSVESVLINKNFLVSCDVEKWKKIRRHDVRPIAS